MNPRTEERLVSLMVCETCKSEVPPRPYCAQCGAVLLGAAAVFTEAAAVATYSEAEVDEHSAQEDILTRLGLNDAAPAAADDIPETQNPSSTAATPIVTAPASTDREQSDELEQGEHEPGDELDAALARTVSDPQLADAEAPASDDTSLWPGWWTVVARWWWVGAAGIVLLLLLGALVAVGVSSATSSTTAPNPSASPASTGPQSGPLPGYAGEVVWGAAAKRAVVSADGNRVLVVYSTSSGTTAKVRDVKKDGASLSSADVDVDAAAMPVAAGNMLLLRNGGTVLAWGPDATAPVTVPAPDGAALLVRSGTGFLVDGATVTVFTENGLVSVTAPRAGMVPLSYLPDTQTVVWASSTGHLVTGTVTGSVVSDVALAAPAPEATVSGWIAATGSRAFLTWSTPAGQVLVVHQATDGAVIDQAPVNGEAIVSPSGTGIAAAGLLVDVESGELVETEFVPAVFLNDQDIYGATPAGSPALWHDDAVVDVTAGLWRPLAVTPSGLLAADATGIALFAPTKN